MPERRSPSPVANAGFSLIEVLVAMAVSIVGIVAVAQLVPWAMDLNQRNRSNSASLVIAERELDQMVRQSLEVRTNVALPDYNFVDVDGASVQMGALPSPATGASNAPPPAPTQSGCPVTGGSIDFGQACSATGYLKTIIVGGINYEVRWNVVTTYGNDQGTMRPATKRITLAARSNESRPLPPASLSVLVAP